MKLLWRMKCSYGMRLKRVGKAAGISRGGAGGWAIALILGLCLRAFAGQGTAAGAVTNVPSRAAGGDRGFSYRNDQRSDPTWSVHVFKVDRNRRDLLLTSTTGSHGAIGMSRLSDQLKDLPGSWGTPIAAVNGDFYTTEDA